MFCNKCGNRLEDNSISCDKCGYVFVYNGVGNPMINKTVDNIDTSSHNGKLIAGLAIGFVLGCGIMFGVTNLMGEKNSDNDSADTVMQAELTEQTTDKAPDSNTGSTTQAAITDNSASADKADGSTTDNATSADNADDSTTDNSTSADNADGSTTENTTAEGDTGSEDASEDTSEGASDGDEKPQGNTFVESLAKYMDSQEASKIYYLLTNPMGFSADELKFVSPAGPGNIVISLAGIQFGVRIDGTVKAISNADYTLYEEPDILLTRDDIISE